MRWLLVLMLTARLAHAEEDRFVLAGAGTAMSKETTGWALRVVSRMDAKHDDDEAHLINGGIVGVEAWSAGDRWGLSFPTGGYVGAQVGSVRTTLGGGLGMYAVEKRTSETEGSGGIAPFVNGTIEKITGDLTLVLEGTISRQLIIERADHNVYTVMLMAGRRLGR